MTIKTKNTIRLKKDKKISWLALIAAICAFTLARSHLNAVDKPNILFIAVDDLRPELACYDKEGLHTPNFDRLAYSGLRFDHAYCQQSVCGASRFSVMSGLYPTATNEQTYHVRHWRTRHPDLVTLNQHFKQNGYMTVGVGKIYHAINGPDADRANWDKWHFVQNNVYADPANLAMTRTFKVLNPATRRGALTEALDVPDETYADGKRVIKAVQILKDYAKARKAENNTKTEKPFFLAVGFSKPHLPFVAPRRYWDIYRRADFQMPHNLGIPPGYPQYAANQNAWELKFYHDYEGNNPRAFSSDLNQRLLHGYAACVSYVDALLGNLLDALEETDLSKNTIIVLWGDHGFKLGDHGSWSKHTNFECDTRVPLLIHVPEKRAGQSTNSLVELVDLFPTLCELTNTIIPEHCQGRSFANLLDNPNQSHREAAYSAYPAEPGISELAASGMSEKPVVINGMGHSIRFGNYRYTEWRPAANQASTLGVLTDLVNDPGELTNVIDDPAHTYALKRAKTLLAQSILVASHVKRQASTFETSFECSD